MFPPHYFQLIRLLIVALTVIGLPRGLCKAWHVLDVCGEVGLAQPAIQTAKYSPPKDPRRGPPPPPPPETAMVGETKGAIAPPSHTQPA